MTEAYRGKSLLAWQWSIYATGHRDRRNLVVHVLTVPMFLAGTFAVASSPFVASGLGVVWVALSGVVAMAVAVALQGRGHAFEETRPVPFTGPLDVVARLFVEQWITFPRFALSGALWRAFRRP